MEVTRVFEFDSAHRVMNEKVKCFNLHGHRFKVEVTFRCYVTKKIGYTIDFKEIKRICGDFIDEFLDHACIVNPRDAALITLCKVNKWRLWVMGLGNEGDFNPSAENIAFELSYMFNHFFWKEKHGISISKIKLYETPNCWVEVEHPYGDYSATKEFSSQLCKWRLEKSDFNYDTREE